MAIQFLVTLLLASSAANASEPAPMTAHIKTLVVREKLTSLEQVIERLPTDLRSRFTLVHSGRALLETSYEFPAAILFGKDARVLLSFNGARHQRGYSALDVLEFDSASQKYKPARFFFSPKNEDLVDTAELENLGSQVFFESKPTSCVACHGPHHHPIFERSYPDWAGFYGSERDHLYGAHLKKETDAYLHFQKDGMKSARYQALLFPSDTGSRMSPYLDESTIKNLGELKAHEYRPNLIMGALLVRQNAKGIFSEMKRSVHYAAYRALLAFTLQKCSFESVDQNRLRLLKEKLDLLGEPIEGFSQAHLNSSMFLYNELKLNRELGAKIPQVLGISYAHWNLAIDRIPQTGYGYWSGYGDTYDFIHAHLIRDIYGDKIKEEFVPTNSSLYELDQLDVILTPRDFQKSCLDLASLSGLN